MTNNIILIPSSKLYHHPNNRSYNKSDLAELADSIRENGIFQNLTVVPYSAADHAMLTVKDPADSYVVVIGNRRLDASQIAGLDELPCVVAQMDLRDQIKTMAQENLLRQDMKPSEEGEVFQMLLDLGETVESVSKSTGFSKQTVRNRLSLLKLDKKELDKADARGGNLTDYLKVSQLKDQDLRDQVLQHVGTANFQSFLKSAQDTEENREILAKVRAVVSTFATEITERVTSRYIASYGRNYTKEPPEVPADATTKKYWFMSNNSGAHEYICLYRELEEITKTKEQQAKEAAEADWKAKEVQLKDAHRRAYELRKAFVKDVPTTTIKKHMSALAYFLGTHLVLRGREQYSTYLENRCKEKDLADFFDIPYKRTDKEVPLTELQVMMSRVPEFALLAEIYLSQENRDAKYYCSRWEDSLGFCVPKHQKNEDLDMIYDLLTTLGYEQSDEEKALRDGTHELYWKTPTAETAPAEPAEAAEQGTAEDEAQQAVPVQEEAEASCESIEEEMDRCPICNAELQLSDGEDTGFGELKMYWTCSVCGSSGAAVLDLQDGNKFTGHEIDEAADPDKAVT